MARKKTFYRWGLTATLFSLVSLAWADPLSEVRKQTETSRLIAGTVDLDSAGRVTGHHFKDVESLSPGVQQWLDARIARWEFDTVENNGIRGPAHLVMSLRLVRKRIDPQQVLLSVAAADFTQAGVTPAPNEELRVKSMLPPSFPKEAARRGVSGTVYVIVRINHEGSVVDADSEQVNLRVVTTQDEMDHFREVLAAAVVKAARGWTFTVPTAGKYAGQEFYLGRVPVDFIGPDARVPKEDKWTAYIPGPRKIIPWTESEGLLPPDALAAGRLYLIDGHGVKLKTALD